MLALLSPEMLRACCVQFIMMSVYALGFWYGGKLIVAGEFFASDTAHQQSLQGSGDAELHDVSAVNRHSIWHHTHEASGLQRQCLSADLQGR